MQHNLTQSLATDSESLEQILSEAMAIASKSLPNAEIPSWLEVAGNFVKIHPWLSLVSAVLILLLISLVIREFSCSYFKTNEILTRLKKIEEKVR